MSLTPEQFLLRFVAPDHRWKLMILSRWPSIIGQLGDRARIEKIERDTITLAVAHPAWAQELSMQAAMLIAACNRLVGAPKITQLRFRVISGAGAAFPKPLPLAADESGQLSLLSVSFPPSSVTLSSVQQRPLEQVRDDTLRSVLAAFYRRCIAQGPSVRFAEQNTQDRRT